MRKNLNELAVKRNRLLYLAVLYLAAVGCVSTGDQRVAQLPPDWPPMGTTQAEVRERLGEPSSQKVSLENGEQREVWGYKYAHASASPLLFVPFVGIAVAATDRGVTGAAHALFITFDAQQRVVGRSWSHEKIGGETAPPTDAYVR
jgi:hypothetical protein